MIKILYQNIKKIFIIINYINNIFEISIKKQYFNIKKFCNLISSELSIVLKNYYSNYTFKINSIQLKSLLRNCNFRRNFLSRSKLSYSSSILLIYNEIFNFLHEYKIIAKILNILKNLSDKIILAYKIRLELNICKYILHDSINPVQIPMRYLFLNYSNKFNENHFQNNKFELNIIFKNMLLDINKKNYTISALTMLFTNSSLTLFYKVFKFKKNLYIFDKILKSNNLNLLFCLKLNYY